MNRWLIFLVIFMLIFSLTGCSTSTSGNNTDANQNITIRIATQYGLQYAPAQIMEKKQLIEKYLPGAKIEWQTFPSGGAINEALAANRIDFAFMGPPPFLISWDKGVKIKLVSSVQGGPNGIVTYRQDIKSIMDLKDDDKIAMPGIGSTQHIFLQMESDKLLNDPHAMDDKILSMSHPDAMNALLNRQVAAHFASAPYYFEELSNPAMHEVLTGREAFGGEFTHIFMVATEEFHNNNPMAYAAVYHALVDAVAIINEQPENAAKILAPIYNLSEEKTLKYITWKEVNYSSTPYGLLKMAEFMKKAGYIKKIPERISDIAFENIIAQMGKKNGEQTEIEKLQY
ncbi:MAG: MetQ/NlpA family ABC transporter substrate-binding protein [Thermoanaerobacteraceae bacterium]|nr:MetQ/NlpA family ABC transporter substrate-binding protein [Thermoanaerobacteraceae bacterium]